MTMNTIAERASNFLIISNDDETMRDEFGAVYGDQIANYYNHEALGRFVFFKDESLLILFNNGPSLELLTTTKDDAPSDLLDWGIQSGRLAELMLGLRQAIGSLE